MNRYLKAVLGIVVLFAIGLVFYFMFSATYGDGLEKTMEESGIQEHVPVYTAPFAYGDDYFAALVAGLIGGGITFGIVYGYLRVARRKRSEAESNETP